MASIGHEPGLQDILTEGIAAGRLRFTTDMSAAQGFSQQPLARRAPRRSLASSGHVPHTGRVTVVTEPQSWVLIGVFTTIMLGGMTITTTLLMRTVTASVNELRGEMNSLRGEMNARFDGLRGEMNARFNAMSTRIDHLDRDISALSRRVWGDPSAGE
jgi:hypothetical protein